MDKITHLNNISLKKNINTSICYVPNKYIYVCICISCIWDIHMPRCACMGDEMREREDKVQDWAKECQLYGTKKKIKRMPCMRGRIVASHIRVFGLVRYMSLYRLLSLSLSQYSLFSYNNKRESDGKG